MFSPIRLTISSDLPCYLMYGDSSFMDYHGLSDDWLATVDAELTALGVDHWGEVDDHAEIGRCDLSGDAGPCVQITGYIRRQGAQVDSHATDERAYDVMRKLQDQYPDAVVRVEATGVETLTVEGVIFTFYPHDLEGSAFDIRVRRAL